MVYNEDISVVGYRMVDISVMDISISYVGYVSKDYHGTQSVEELSSREVGRIMHEVDRITAFTL